MKRKVQNPESGLYEWVSCEVKLKENNILRVDEEEIELSKGRYVVQVRGTRFQLRDASKCLVDILATTTEDLAEWMSLLKQYSSKPKKKTVAKKPVAVKKVVNPSVGNKKPKSKILVKKSNPIANISPVNQLEEDSREQLSILTRLETVLDITKHEKKLSNEKILNLEKELTARDDQMALLKAENQQIRHQIQEHIEEKLALKTSLSEYKAEVERLRKKIDITEHEASLSSRERTRLRHENSTLVRDLKRLDKLVYGRF